MGQKKRKSVNLQLKTHTEWTSLVVHMIVLLHLLTLIGVSASCHLTVETSDELRNLPNNLAAALRSHTSSSDYHVCFRPNVIYFGSHLALEGARHNHPHGGRIVWRSTEEGGEEGETTTPPPVLSGGSPLNKWYRCNDGVHCPSEDWNDVYVHYTSDVANLSSSFLPVRNLWVDGSRIARSYVDGDTLGWSVNERGFSTPGKVSSSFVDNKVELLWPRTIRNWIEPRCVITGVTGNNVTVDPVCWSNLIQRNNNKLPPVPTYVENIITPPSPGEFVSTPLYIFYKPSSSHPYAPPTNAWVPIQEQIMSATGLNNHTFQGLQFSHTTWRIPVNSGGYVPTQTLVTSSKGEPRGAVEMIQCRGCIINGSSFMNIGAPYCLSVGGASQDIIISNNIFHDSSGGAIKIGNVNDTRAVTTDVEEQDIRYEVINNFMDDISVEFKGGAAIFAGYVAKTNITHNTIKNTGYTGISLGWGWGSHVSGKQTFAADNHIVGNRLLSIMSALNDGGCTYTLGPQPRSTVTGNFCSSDSAPVVGCFYHDNGSRYFSTKNNVAETSPAPCIFLTGGGGAPAHDIAVSNLWCRGTAPVRNDCAAENCTIDSKTLYILGVNAPWPMTAQSIVDASGVPSGVSPLLLIE